MDYRDVKVAFEVTEPNTSDRILINQAQISKDSDKDGNDVTDQDSVPDKWNEGEDDQDIEKVKVQYFDLSLRKWVTQAIVTENGEEKIIESATRQKDDPEDVVKVDLKKSKINKVTIKFRYKIRVKNEGNIAGYAKELKDCNVGGISVYGSNKNAPEFSIAKGIKVGDKEDKVREAFGSPTDTSNYDEYNYLRYGEDDSITTIVCDKWNR